MTEEIKNMTEEIKNITENMTEDIKNIIKATLPTVAPGKRTIVVFGGNGFVGSHVCKNALEEGYNVISISRQGQPPFWCNPNKKKV